MENNNRKSVFSKKLQHIENASHLSNQAQTEEGNIFQILSKAIEETKKARIENTYLRLGKK